MNASAFDPSPWIRPESLAAGLRPRPDNLAEPVHTAVVERVCRFFQAMKADQPRAPEAYQPGGEWAAYLAERRHLYDSLQAGQIAEAATHLRNFWRNELGPIVKEYANFQQLAGGDPERVDRFQRCVVRNYLIWKETFGQPACVLEIPQIGNPWGYVIEDRLIAPKATRFHALATQIQGLAANVRRPLIAEIGGGYGGMAYYLLRDAPTATYIDFDLPETLALAAYYLLCALPERPMLFYGEANASRSDQWRHYAAVLMPNFMLPELPTGSVDVFANSFSLSEVPLATLEEYVSQIQRTVRGYFLHNNMDRAGVVNRGYERIPASSYPIDGQILRLVYKHFDLFHGHDSDYREFLYKRIAA